MAHIERVFSDNTLCRGYKIPGVQMRNLDRNTVLMMNGDGGNYAPVLAIILTGAGLTLAAPSDIRGASSIIEVSENAPLVFDNGGPNDYFALPAGHPGREKNIRHGLIEVFAPSVAAEVYRDSGLSHSAISAKPGSRFMTPLKVYNGARLVRVVIDFRVPYVHVLIPQVLPRCRVIAVRYDGEILSLHSTLSTPPPIQSAAGVGLFQDVDSEGFAFFSPPPESAAEWNNGGAMKTQVFMCNTDHVIDLSQYSYFVEIIDEGGVGSWVGAARNEYTTVTSHCVDINWFTGQH